LACQLCALFLGYFYRIYFGPHKTSPRVRHVIQILIGVPLTYFCFGRFDTAACCSYLLLSYSYDCFITCTTPLPPLVCISCGPVSICLSVHPSRASIVSKWLNGSSSFLAQRLPSSYPILCWKGIWISPKIKVVSSSTWSQTLDLEQFRSSTSTVTINVGERSV